MNSGDSLLLCTFCATLLQIGEALVVHLLVGLTDGRAVNSLEGLAITKRKKRNGKKR